MNVLTPPIRAKFSFMNETITIGWANKSDGGEYVWCRSNEATFVIGENVRSTSGLTNWIAPIKDIGNASRKPGWERDRPDYLLDGSQKDADKNIGRRVRVWDGKLEFD